MGIDLSLLPPKLSARLALCWALIVADKDDVVNKIRSATPLRKNPFKDPYTFFRDVGLELAPPKNTQDPMSYLLWERRIKPLYDLIQEILGSKVLASSMFNVMLSCLLLFACYERVYASIFACFVCLFVCG